MGVSIRCWRSVMAVTVGARGKAKVGVINEAVNSVCVYVEREGLECRERL